MPCAKSGEPTEKLQSSDLVMRFANAGICFVVGLALVQESVVAEAAPAKGTRPQAAKSQAAINKRDEAIKLYNQHDYAGAITLLDQHLAAYSQDYSALYYLALCYQMTGRFNIAANYYKQVETLAPNSNVGVYAKQILAKLTPAGSTGVGPKESSSASSSSGAAKSSSAYDRPLEAGLPDECDLRCEKDSNGRVWLDVSINGKSMRMIFDTGAPGVFVGKNQLDQAGISLGNLGKPDGQTSGSSSDAAIDIWKRPCKVRVGQLERNLPVEITENNPANALLGQEFFRGYDYTIDAGAGRIHLKKKGTAGSAIRNAYSVPFNFKEAGNRVIVEIEINGRKNPVMFDTGNTASVLSFHSEEQARKYGITVPADAPTATTRGVSGSGTSKIVNVGRIKLGPIDRANLDVYVRNGSNTDVELPLLGQPFWQDYQYTIDMQTKQVHFVRR